MTRQTPPAIRQSLQKALAIHQAGQVPLAITEYKKILLLDSRNFDALQLLGLAYYQMGQPQLAIETLDRAIGLNRSFASAYNNRGLAHQALGRWKEALADFNRTLELSPGNPEALGNRGNVLRELGQFAEAIDDQQAAIRLSPRIPELHNNLGMVFKDKGEWPPALACFEKALALRPQYFDALVNRANALTELRRFEEALATYDLAVRLNPRQAEVYRNRGDVLNKLARPAEALASYGTAIRLKRNIDYLPGDLLHTRMKMCEWQGLDDELALIADEIRSGGKSATPWIALGVFDDPGLHLAAAKTYAADKFRRAQPQAVGRRGGDRIRIGYYSADFHNHAVSYLIAELFEEHDRSAFEIHGFSLGPDKKDEMRARVSSAFDSFHDITGMSDRAVAAMSRDLGIDIAVDLTGYTQSARTGIFAERCAPVQVNYLGYPGTMGAGFIDYIVADPVLIPETHRQFYSEKIAYVPDCYQANDSRRAIADKAFTRAELGLPEDGFVFCCFNNSFKILPETFECWMRILGRVEASVLWLLDDNEAVSRNLRSEAAKHGIDPNRLVFAKRMALPEHLARHRAADLFLDTLPYNAHTTASDALWAGLPLLTCMGEAFAARVAASLLTALDMQDLIVTDMAAYEDLAVALAQDPERLTALRERLSRTRLSSPLFSGKAVARSMEAAYREMLDRHDKGLAPDNIFVARAPG